MKRKRWNSTFYHTVNLLIYYVIILMFKEDLLNQSLKNFLNFLLIINSILPLIPVLKLLLNLKELQRKMKTKEVGTIFLEWFNKWKLKFHFRILLNFLILWPLEFSQLHHLIKNKKMLLWWLVLLKMD